MKQFQVPQFLTIEDKVIGPFTIKQALFIGGGVALIVVSRMFLESYIFYPVAMFVAGLTVILAFLKINTQPFPVVLKNAFLYMLRPRLYIWRREAPKKQEEKKKKEVATVAPSAKKLSAAKLSELAWSLDIKEKTGQETNV